MGKITITKDKDGKRRVDNSNINAVLSQVNSNSITIDQMVNKLVSDYCKPLDDFMEKVNEILQDEDKPPTSLELDDISLQLPTLLYFTGEAQETLGIREDIAKAIKLSVFNECYDEVVKGTIADKTAAAELMSQSESIVFMVHQRAYKKVKLRMEAASELLQSVKKVITRRMAELEMGRVDSFRTGR